MVDVPINMPDISDDIRALSMIQNRIRRLYTTTQNNKTVQKGFISYVQPMLEVRYAWDHFSEALLDSDDTWNTDMDRIDAEMANAQRHMLRCYTDLTEWRLLHVKIYTRKITKRLNPNDIESAMPGYYGFVFPMFDKAERTLIDIKGEPERNFVAIVALLDQVNENCETILDALNVKALEALRALKRKSGAALLLRGFIFIGTAVIGALIMLLIQLLY